MNRFLPLLVSILALALAACTAPRAPPGAADPAAAAVAFSRAVQEGDTASAWSMLSARTQARADALAARARVSADGGPESGKTMLFSGALPGGIVTARELSNDGGAAALSISVDGGSPRELHAVHEADGWKIELDL